MIEQLELDKIKLMRENQELMQIYSSQKSLKSNNDDEPAVINLDEEEYTDYSPSKQFLHKNLEESSFLPTVIPAKIEKKKNVIKKVRFHDDEPEQSYYDEDEEQESSYEVRVAKRRQVTRATAEIEELEINQETE
jgi:hypothetical protein